MNANPLDVAIAELNDHVSEIPPGSNWGPRVEEYLFSVGINIPNPWCMAFVYWCFEMAHTDPDKPNPLLKTGCVLAQWNHTPSEHKRYMPQVGDIFIMQFDSIKGHAGFVRSVDGSLVHTVEGNSNDKGEREGTKVIERIRNKASMKGFIRYI